MGVKLKDMDWDGKGTKAWRFWCPGCQGWHAPIEGRWTFNGNYEKPTFSPSLLVTVGHHPDPSDICHSFVTDGKIQYLSDCTHSMAGQTVDIPDIDDV